MWWWLLGILVLLIGLTWLPVDLRWRLVYPESKEPEITLIWAWLVKIPLSSAKETPAKPEPASADHPSEPHPGLSKPAKPEHEPRATEKPAKKLEMRDIRMAIEFFRHPRAQKRVLRFFREALGIVKLRRANLSVAFGLDDPALTGEVFGYAAPFLTLLSMVPRLRWNADPIFNGHRFEFASDGEARMIPGHAMWVVFSFAFSPHIWIPAYRAWRHTH